MTPTDSLSQLSFEEALQRLEEVVRNLENGDATLEQSLANYQQGVGLLKRCYEVLNQAEQQVRQMSEEDEQGRPIVQSFPRISTGEGEPAPGARASDSRY